MRWFVIPSLLPAIVLLINSLSLPVHGRFPETTTSSRIGSNISALYVLGDSSVDCGNNTLFYPLLHSRFSLYPCDGSDASLLPQLLGEKMGLPLIRPFYTQNGSLNEVIRGLNFGSTQATIMSRRGRQSHQSLTQQLRQVSETLQLLQLHLREDTALQFTKSSIFILSFGKEDYTDLLLRNISSKTLDYDVHDFATILVNQVTSAMRYLYDVNARKIICLGILPLGFTPRVAWTCNKASSARDDDHGKGCVDYANKLVLEYNELLAKHTEELNKELTDAQIVFCDVYKGLMEIMSKRNLYGFEDTNSACCGLGLYNATVGCISMDTACDQASKHVWWDLLSPTSAVNSILANAAWSGRPFSGLCHPITIHELVTKV
ncbi:GDSL esterase/lipase At1g71250-like [Neltuma alba]|uniref:GDSL esterase/lipase At1g71250-like n=1 Tax=Neltuma alba TaxID=207710 RepID=UPI0010A59BF8|nr:GDSL esterase/lipase At1g71250-like [Prosopis alba]